MRTTATNATMKMTMISLHNVLVVAPLLFCTLETLVEGLVVQNRRPLASSSFVAPGSHTLLRATTKASNDGANGNESKGGNESGGGGGGGGAPQYQKQNGILSKVEKIGEGSFLLHVDYENPFDCGEDRIDYHYKPGHVLALEIQPPTQEEKIAAAAASSTSTSARVVPSRFVKMNEKTQKDVVNNDGWLRGPYTVSRGRRTTTGMDNDKDAVGGFQVLIKEVGFKSHVMATATPGTRVRFGGKFHVPIVDGIAQQVDVDNASAAAEAENAEAPAMMPTERVVFISTGVGVGPCVGAIEDLLACQKAEEEEKTSPTTLSSIRRIDLVASFRTEEEVALRDDLDKLVAATVASEDGSTGAQFHWKPIVTSRVGRLSESETSLGQALDVIEKTSTTATSTMAATCSIASTHYHLIGNGQMVNEWKAALFQAGVPKARVTVEAYFNHQAKSNTKSVETIARYIESRCTTSPERRKKLAAGVLL